MPQPKYFKAIRAAQIESAAQPHPPLSTFDFNSIAAVGMKARLKETIARALMQPVYGVLRRFFPVQKMLGIYHISRDAQVRDVLGRPDIFQVPFGPEMKELAGGETFALGLDGADHARQNALLRQVINPEQDMALIAALSHRIASALLENSNGRVDAMNDVIKRTVAEVCVRYFGFTTDDPDGFADWTISASAVLFGDPFGDPKVRALALNGSRRICIMIDESIQKAKLLRARKPDAAAQADTLVDRLLKLQEQYAKTDPISDKMIRAMLFGMVSGFIPTNSLASGKMLDELLRRPAAFQSAVTAAKRGADGREDMKKILLEAGRLNPTLAPGQWRYCPQAAEIMVGGRSKTIPTGAVLMVATMSALRDERTIPSPKRFWPERVDASGNAVAPDVLFGFGVHQCLGKYLAIEQITSTMTALLAAPGLKRAQGKAGKMAFVGPFPRNLAMEFDTPSSKQSMFLVIAPVTSGANKDELDAEIAALGHPAGAAIREALDKANRVHFTSFATIASEKRLDLIWELSVDGDIASALDAIAHHAGPLVHSLFTHCGLAAEADLAAFLKKHVVELHGKPWGATGLNFSGTGEFAVPVIERQAKFANFVERALTDFLSSEATRGSHPTLALNHVRRIINQDRILALAGTAAQRALIQEAAAAGYDSYAMQPNATRLQLAAFRSVSKIGGLLHFLKSRDALVVWVPAVLIALGLGWLIWNNIAVSPSAGPLWIGASFALRTALTTMLVITALIATFFLAIRAAEKRDLSDSSQADPAHISTLNSIENAPGYAQNHMLAVGRMKPGLLRRCAHAAALWAIRMVIVSNFRPGLLLNMGTIHYARWWRLPGTNIAAFYSNYDGSWESYLEDFIMRARWGMNAVWSNWQGFPPARFLAFKGVDDGDRFKRWVRTQQQPVPFWYSRFPTLTAEQIRSNALILSGVAKAQSSSEAAEWLRCFGSMPRVENVVESDEVQALVFSGLKRLPHSTALILKLPEGQPLGEWLSWIRGETQALEGLGASADSTKTDGLMGGGVVVPVTGVGGVVEGYSLAQSLTLTFGDRPLVWDASAYDTAPTPIDTADAANNPEMLGRADAQREVRRAVFLGCTALGLSHFGVPNAVEDALLASFPPAFRMGMNQRGRILGDMGTTDAQNWRWNDASAEAVLMIYAETPADLGFATEVHSALIQNYGGTVLSQTECASANPDKPDFEHFGYRDGIAQPVIRGTVRATKGVPARDVLEPGEMILGYANGGGYFPPSPVLPAESDLAHDLPILSAVDIGRFPDFGDKSFGSAPRDFGRNGSFVVIRELAQDVEGFNAFVERKALELRGDAPSDTQTSYRDLYKLIGQFPDKDWVKAKLMGRWPNGRPLIGNPVNAPSPKPGDSDEANCRAAEIENDFSYGSDDPQGMACPFGAHIRRTNPRDSKQPGDPEEQAITNRHRLLRRGRAYVKQGADGTQEKGLLFVSLCADLERQFEFVQQAWVNAPAFHGLAHEPDPISGADMPDAATGGMCPRQFSIPTPAGPIKLKGMQNFVTVKAGGYFFLPSRSALTWMTAAALKAGL